MLLDSVGFNRLGLERRKDDVVEARHIAGAGKPSLKTLKKFVGAVGNRPGSPGARRWLAT